METRTGELPVIPDSDALEYIYIKGARVHNLKNVDVLVPRNKLVVVTGVSGSGKSSLTIDTLYAEGQRRYVESLSSYARQFLTRMNKPEVDYIKGICPAIAIEQRQVTRTSRSTVGTLTEIYDYLRLLYARIGKTFSPVSGREVKKDEVSDVVDFILKQEKDATIYILSPFLRHKGRAIAEDLNVLIQKGYRRLLVNGKPVRIQELLESERGVGEAGEEVFVMIDRFKVGNEDLPVSRIGDSVQTAMYEGHGECWVSVDEAMHHFSIRFELDGIQFEEPTPQFFNFNSPYGACPKCEGFGSVIGPDENLIVPDKNLSIYEGAIAPWRGEKMKEWLEVLLNNAHKFDFPIHRPYKYLTAEEKALLWTGNEYFSGLNEFFRYLEEKSYKIQYRVMLSRYRGKTVCPECKGTRLRKEAGYVKINGKSLQELIDEPIEELYDFFRQIKLTAHEEQIASRILTEINNRLEYMMDVGLGYLTLNRASNTLSGGESQRISLTRALGSNLTNSLYILDEPSVGLHPRDTKRLVKILLKLRDLGNTVVVVEHEEEIIRAADYIIDMGPEAGRFGGEVVYQGSLEGFKKESQGLTAQYLNGKLEIPLPEARRKPLRFIEITGANQNNLKQIDVRIPVQAMTVVTGVSGSGKTSLIKQILYPALSRLITGTGNIIPGDYDELKGDVHAIEAVEFIDQKPIGKSSRSNPVIYIKAYDSIRGLFASQKLSQLRGYTPSYFSFNVDGGRCPVCKGDGEIVVEMQFLADVKLVCEECGGKRFKDEVLDVTFHGKNIHDILEMSVDEAIEFFSQYHPPVAANLQPLADVGLGYIRLGQSSSILSGGEAQRVKLASYLGKGGQQKSILFLFDEPTTGLHFHDIHKLLQAINQLIENGHTVVVIEHNIEVIKCADWIIDLGPEGGEQGGYLVYQGVPEGLIKVEQSYTGRFLRNKLKAGDK